jgi:hypothetical protein
VIGGGWHRIGNDDFEEHGEEWSNVFSPAAPEQDGLRSPQTNGLADQPQSDLDPGGFAAPVSYPVITRQDPLAGQLVGDLPPAMSGRLANVLA